MMPLCFLFIENVVFRTINHRFLTDKTSFYYSLLNNTSLMARRKVFLSAAPIITCG